MKLSILSRHNTDVTYDSVIILIGLNRVFYHEHVCVCAIIENKIITWQNSVWL